MTACRVYVVVCLPEDRSEVATTIGCTLKFLVRDCDPNTGVPEGDEGYQDEYVVIIHRCFCEFEKRSTLWVKLEE